MEHKYVQIKRLPIPADDHHELTARLYLGEVLSEGSEWTAEHLFVEFGQLPANGRGTFSTAGLHELSEQFAQAVWRLVQHHSAGFVREFPDAGGPAFFVR
jgi:hypothetical protein